MDLKKSFGVDKEAAEQGKWFQLEDEGRVKVARLNNPSFKTEVARLQKPHLLKLNNPRMDNTALVNELTAKAMSKTILVGWEGISIDGEELEYSPEKAYELFTEYPDFLEAVARFAIERNNFTPEDKDALVGKS